MNEHDPKSAAADNSANPLASLLEIQPDPAAIERAIRRAKESVASAPIPLASGAAKPSRSRAFPWRLIAGLAASLAFVALWFAWPRSLVAHELATMQERVAQTRTVEFDLVYADGDDNKSRIRILESGFVREDLADGSYLVSDLKHGRQLMVFPDSRSAVLAQGLAPRHENFYHQIRRIPGESAQPLGESVVNGRPAAGYRVIRPKVRRADEFPWTSGTLVIWIDRDTQLPLKIECHPLEGELALESAEDLQDEAAGDDSQGVDPLPRSYSVIDNIRFNAPFEKSLFQFRAPAGHALTVTGAERLAPLPGNASLAAPDLQPTRGLGQVRFEMSPAQVESLLGKADQSDEMTLDYFSRGYSLDFDENKLYEIRCYAQPVSEWVVRDFAGQTAQGVRLGDSRDAIERIYGPPDSADVFEGETLLIYDRQGLTFTMIQGKVVEILATPGL